MEIVQSNVFLKKHLHCLVTNNISEAAMFIDGQSRINR